MQLSHFVETLLKPYAQAANSFIQDTTEFLNKLKKIKTVLQNTILATLDVSSLYTNITHNNGLKALKNRLPDNQLTDVIIQSTEFILKHNYFNFGNEQFLQLKDTAMGTKMAPQYANIFMSNLEENFLQNTHNKPLLYLRYIDNIFLLWTQEEKLLQFHKDFNSEDPDIHFTMNHLTEEVNFLDTAIRLKNNTLQTSLYKKPTHYQTVTNLVRESQRTS